jgi:hypothetical protein
MIIVEKKKRQSSSQQAVISFVPEGWCLEVSNIKARKIFITLVMIKLVVLSIKDLFLVFSVHKMLTTNLGVIISIFVWQIKKLRVFKNSPKYIQHKGIPQISETEFKSPD